MIFLQVKVDDKIMKFDFILEVLENSEDLDFYLINLIEFLN